MSIFCSRRCEQQYRLHRLLAFDPNNECRGIFSDWFRFPSFCVCKCYSVPAQLVADLARNPRKSDFSPARRRKNRPSPSSSSASKPFAAASRELDGRPRLENHRMSKKTRLFVDQEMGIPAVFPYEGKAAIMAEINHGRGTDSAAAAKDDDASAETMSYSYAASGGAAPQPLKDRYGNVVPLLSQLDGLAAVAAADGHIDNAVESDQLHYRKSNKEARQLDDHFFYNQPIIEFRLPDGTTGKIDDKIPRRRK
jgi:hypothetical protein